MENVIETKAMEYPDTITLADLIRLADGDMTAEVYIGIPNYDDPTLYISRGDK